MAKLPRRTTTTKSSQGQFRNIASLEKLGRHAWRMIQFRRSGVKSQAPPPTGRSSKRACLPDAVSANPIARTSVGENRHARHALLRHLQRQENRSIEIPEVVNSNPFTSNRLTRPSESRADTTFSADE